MKTLKLWFSKIKIFIINILKGLINVMKVTSEANAQVEIAKIDATKEVIMVTGKATKDIIMSTGKAISNVIKVPFKNKKNMRVTGIVIVGMGIGIGGSLIISSYVI